MRSMTATLQPGLPVVGDMTDDGALIRAQVIACPTDHGFAEDDLLVMQILHSPAVGPKGKFVPWAFVSNCYDRSLITAEALETNVVATSNTFVDFYNLVRTNAGFTEPGRLGGRHWLVAEQMLRDLILAEYDMDDPVEAADAFLFAMSGTVTTFPRTLLD
jgi:hypothetical protein